MPALAERIAQLAKQTGFESLSDRTVHEAKRRVLDSIGTALGAWDSRPARVTRTIASQVALEGGASLLGSTHRTTPELATFSNGALVRYLDFNDTYLSKEPAHPSDNIPAVWAVSQLAGRGGRDAITAIVLAYELQCRLCDAASLRAHGWDHVYYGALSTALAAGWLLDCTEKQLVHALGIAGVCNFATRQTRTGQISDWKACAFSNAARQGVFAARLAKEGLTGPNEIFEGPKGLFHMVTGPFELAWAKDADDWMINRTYIKFWPAEYHSQSAIQAALELRPEVGSLENVRKIRIESFEAAVSIIGSEPEKWRPTSRETADHSMPFCVVMALRDGTITRETFRDENIRNPQVHALLDKVEIVETPECNAGYPDGIPNKLIIELADGRRLEKRVDYPRGHAGNPMSDDEVIAKFRGLAEGVIDAATADRIVEQVFKLETLEDITPILAFETNR